MFEKALASATGMALRLWWMLSDAEKWVAIWSAIMLLIALVCFARFAASWIWFVRGATVSLWLTAIIGWYTLAQVYDYLQDKKEAEFEKFKKDFWIKWKEDFAQILQSKMV
jgi:hypothetical protein